jgi:predicted Holliday junction resolvase-like endonuclease
MIGLILSVSAFLIVMGLGILYLLDQLKIKRIEVEELKLKISNIQDENQRWKETELPNLLNFERADAVKRSKSIIRGQNVEQFIPFSEEFLSKYSPSDAKFLGRPIDYILFHNASKVTDGENLTVEVIFADCKTGSAKLTKVQKAIKEAIEAKRVRWETWELK